MKRKMRQKQSVLARYTNVMTIRDMRKKPAEKRMERKKQRVEALCRQVMRGDTKAEKELKRKLGDPKVKDIVSNFAMESGGVNLMREKSTIKTSVSRGRGQPTKGSLFRPYQGGIPSLGKKS